MVMSPEEIELYKLSTVIDLLTQKIEGTRDKIMIILTDLNARLEEVEEKVFKDTPLRLKDRS